MAFAVAKVMSSYPQHLKSISCATCKLTVYLLPLLSLAQADSVWLSTRFDMYHVVSLVVHIKSKQQRYTGDRHERHAEIRVKG